MEPRVNLAMRAIGATFVAALAAAAIPPARAQTNEAIESVVRNYLASHPEDIEKIIESYLARHPDAMQAAIMELLRKRQAAAAKAATPDPKALAEKAALIKSNAATLFGSTHQVTLNAPGDVTLVEFFDYNCGYCRRALPDLLALMKADPKLRIVLKELPVLGPGSAEAARIAIAVRMQDPSGAKYLEFHQRMLRGGPADKPRALAAASALGLDMARLEIDAASDEASATLAESLALARSLGIRGTPSYVVGDAVVAGAVGYAELKLKIEAQRR